MATAFDAVCDDCGVTTRHLTLVVTEATARAHTCSVFARPRERCINCGLHYPMLVEGSDMCIRCDSLHYPDAPAACAQIAFRLEPAHPICQSAVQQDNSAHGPHHAGRTSSPGR